jgi:hypothetical protein
MKAIRCLRPRWPWASRDVVRDKPEAPAAAPAVPPLGPKPSRPAAVPAAAVAAEAKPAEAAAAPPLRRRCPTRATRLADGLHPAW